MLFDSKQLGLISSGLNALATQQGYFAQPCQLRDPRL